MHDGDEGEGLGRAYRRVSVVQAAQALGHDALDALFVSKRTSRRHEMAELVIRHRRTRRKLLRIAELIATDKQPQNADDPSAPRSTHGFALVPRLARSRRLGREAVLRLRLSCPARGI